jgi:4-amino-4-deoxy-L-arabinose transferase-like glycosyltransferase
VLPRGPAERLVLALLTASFALAGVAFAVSTPMFENPDEATHVDMVRHYARHPTEMAGPSLRQTQQVRGAMAATGLFDTPSDLAVAGLPPTRPDYRAFGDYGEPDEPAAACPVTCQNYQFIHPPGWYLVAAPVAKVLDDQPFPRTVLALRLLGVAFGAVMVWATWWLAQQLWPGRSRRALVAAGATASFGPLAAALGSVNNDGLMLPLMAVALALMAVLLRRGSAVRWAVALGVVVGLGLVVKGQFVVVAVVGVAAVALAPAEGLRARVRTMLAYLVPAGVGGLWWLRVLVDSRSVTPEGSELLAPERDGPWSDTSFPGFLVDRLDDVGDRFFGRYSWQNETLPSELLVVAQVGVLLLALAWLVGRRWRPLGLDSLRVALLASVPFLLLGASALTAWETYRSNGEEHGLAPRYLYGAVPVLAVMLTAALVVVQRRLAPRHAAAGHAAFLVLAGALGVVVSLAVSAHAMYFTTDWTLVFQRAGIVAPVSRPKAWLAVLGLLWVAATLAAAWLVARRRLDDEDAPALARQISSTRPGGGGACTARRARPP